MRNFCLVLSLLFALSACNMDTGGTGGNGGTNPTEPYVVENPTQEVIVEPTSDNAPLPTHTPVPSDPEMVATAPLPVTSSDDCEAVASASGIVIDAEQERAEAPQTLPNGRPFPNTEPRSPEIQSQGVENRQQVLIQFTPESTPDERNEFIRQIGGSKRTEIDALDTYIVTLRPNTTLTDIPTSPIVLRVELDSTASASQEPSPPNDSRYGEQWALPVVGLPEAWSAVPAGRTVVVAVVDSGVCLNHPDLAGRILPGYDFVDGDNDPSDVFGHGCGVAGVIAANANNGVGIAGIAPNTQIMPIRVLDSRGQGNYSNIASGIIYAADNGANIINLSLAGSSNSVILEQAVAYAVARGVIVIAAAGNFGSPNTYYPAAYPSVIAVGSVDVNLQRSSFSNYGTFVDLYAPGRDILTTSMNGDYAFNSGTSFAAPIVAGITAMTETMNAPLNTENNIVFLYPPENLPNCP